MTPSCCNMPRSSLTAQCSVSLPSSTWNQCDCRAANRFPLGATVRLTGSHYHPSKLRFIDCFSLRLQ